MNLAIKSIGIKIKKLYKQIITIFDEISTDTVIIKKIDSDKITDSSKDINRYL